MEPPVSVPMAPSAMPATSAAADPPLDPPADRVVSSGLRTAPNAESSLVVPSANSCRLVLPTSTAPAAFSRAVTIGVGGGRGERTHVRGGRGGHAGLVDQVLERDRDPVQRPAIVPARQLPIGLPCRGTRAVRR